MFKLSFFKILSAAAMLSTSVVLVAQELPRSASPDDAKVAIISPQNGATVATEFTVFFGLKGMGVAPAGAAIENTGHHHLLVNQKDLPALDQPMGSPPLHFGKGQTQTTLTLEPGEHTLQLILGDKLHIPHLNPIYSEKITITVK